ncbi:hypothetical protein J4228_03045 [Candidatus Woesearchaeota archaeon]|nr:hypothetical protein [Candidatus Woesearchaeota archaeon]
MKFAKIIPLFLISLLLVLGVQAQVEPEEISIFSEGQDLGPVLSGIQPFFSRLSVIVGGIFGIYVILIVIRIYYERKKLKVLQDIRYDLDQLNLHNNIPYSLQKKKLWERMLFSLQHLIPRKTKLKTKQRRKR